MGGNASRANSRDEVTGAPDLLCVPQLGVLRQVGEGRYTLQMPKETLARRLRALVAVFERLSGNPDVGERPGEQTQVVRDRG